MTIEMNMLKAGDIRGLTIMEVLMAGVIFMTGFTTLSFLLSETLGRYSAGDQTTAANLARQYMEETLAAGDLAEFDRVIRYSGVAYRVVCRIESIGPLSIIEISVSREKTGEILIELYNEKYQP